jgi:hypothetical protein
MERLLVDDDDDVVVDLVMTGAKAPEKAAREKRRSV